MQKNHGHITLAAICLLIIGSVVVANIDHGVYLPSALSLNTDEIRFNVISLETESAEASKKVELIAEKIFQAQLDFTNSSKILAAAEVELPTLKSHLQELISLTNLVDAEILSKKSAYAVDLPEFTARNVAEAKATVEQVKAEHDKGELDRVKQRNRLGMIPQNHAEALRRLQVYRSSEALASSEANRKLASFQDLRESELASLEERASLLSLQRSNCEANIQRLNRKIAIAKAEIDSYPTLCSLLQDRLNDARANAESTRRSLTEQRTLAARTPQHHQQSPRPPEPSSPTLSFTSPYLVASTRPSTSISRRIYTTAQTPNKLAESVEIVEGYFRKDGKWIESYHRTYPDMNKRNNFSYGHNVNPFTGSKSYHY